MNYGIEPPNDLWRFNISNISIDKSISDKLHYRLSNININEVPNTLTLEIYDRKDDPILDYLRENIMDSSKIIESNIEVYSRSGDLEKTEYYNLKFSKISIHEDNETEFNKLLIKFNIVN